MLTLVVDDDPDWAAVISRSVRSRADEVVVVDSISGTVRFTSAKVPDMFLIDLMLPDGSGYDLCKRLRMDFEDTPILIVSSLDRPVDKVEGLRSGADDFISKPFYPSELRARVDAVAGRYKPGSRSTSKSGTQCLVAGSLRVDVDAPSVYVGQRDARLTLTEIDIVTQLVKYAGQALPYAFLAEQVWGHSNLNASALVKRHVSCIRKKIQDAGGNPKALRTIHGIGYMFAEEE